MAHGDKPAPVRERLIAAIQSAVSGSYGAPVPEDERDVPITIVQDGTDEASDDYGVTKLVMPVTIARAAVAVGTTREQLRAQANQMLAEIIEDMHADETFDCRADGVDYVGGGVLVELGRLVFAEGAFRVRYHHVRGNPRQIDE